MPQTPRPYPDPGPGPGPDDSDDPATSRGRGSRRHRWPTAVLLGLPVVAVLAVPLYARAEPRLLGVPFFYWYQFGCLLLAAGCLTAAARRAGRAEAEAGGAVPW